MARRYTKVEDACILIAQFFDLSDTAIGRVLDRSSLDIRFRRQALQTKTRITSGHGRGPARIVCMREGCKTVIVSEHPGIRHCDACRVWLADASPLAPDVFGSVG